MAALKKALRSIREMANNLLQKELLFVFLIPLLLYSALAFGEMFFPDSHIPPFPEFTADDEVSNYLLTKAIVEKGTLEISQYVTVNPFSVFQGKSFSVYPPGLSLLAVPFYLIGKVLSGILSLRYPMLERFLFFSCTFVSSISGAITSLFIFKTCKFLNASDKAAFFSSFSYSFATISLRYSRGFFPHSLTAALVTLGLYMAFKAAREEGNDKKFVLLSGLFLGYLALTRHTDFILIIPIVTYLIVNKKTRNITYFVLPIIIFSTASLAYNYACFQNPFKTGYDYTILKYFGVQSIYELFNRPLYEGLFSLLISPKIGLFFYSPILLFSILGILYLYKKYKNETITILSASSITIILYSICEIECMNWSARYLSPIVPLLTISLSQIYDSFRGKNKAFLALTLLTILSVFFQVLGIYPCFYYSGPCPLLTAILFLTTDLRYLVGVLTLSTIILLIFIARLREYRINT